MSSFSSGRVQLFEQLCQEEPKSGKNEQSETKEDVSTENHPGTNCYHDVSELHPVRKPVKSTPPPIHSLSVYSTNVHIDKWAVIYWKLFFNKRVTNILTEGKNNPINLSVDQIIRPYKADTVLCGVVGETTSILIAKLYILSHKTA